MTAHTASGSLAMRSSSALASVGHSSVRSMPISFMSSRRGSGSKNASRLGIAPIFPKPAPGPGSLEPPPALGESHPRPAGPRDPVEGGVRDVVGDLVLDGELGAAADVD